MVQIVRSIVVIAVIPYFVRIFKFKQVKLIYDMSWKLFTTAMVLIILTGIEMMLALIFCQALLWTNEVRDQLDVDGLMVADIKTPLFVMIIIMYMVTMVIIALIWFAYYYLIKKYNTEMKEFHYFLASYRQTPRSRFIKKY